MSSLSSDPYGAPSGPRGASSDRVTSDRNIDDESDADDPVAAHNQDNALLADDPLEQSSSTKLVASELDGKIQADVV